MILRVDYTRARPICFACLHTFFFFFATFKFGHTVSPALFLYEWQKRSNTDSMQNNDLVSSTPILDCAYRDIRMLREKGNVEMKAGRLRTDKMTFGR